MRNGLRPALAATLLTCAAGASAQSFSGTGPAPVLMLPSTERAATVTPVELAAAARPVPAGAAETGPTLRRLPAIAAPMRLWGENGRLSFPLYVTEAEARAGGRFQVGYVAAVSILPETARLTFSLNGIELGSAAIDGARGARSLGFDVPPGVMSRGFNRIDIAVAQRHRVDCSIPATYELWTQIDPATTGLLARSEGPSDPADLPAIRGGPDGAVPIRLIQTGEKLSLRTVERGLAALQATVLAGRFIQPAADFGPTAEDGDGLALAVGRVAELAGSVDLASLGPVTGPRLALLPRTAERRPVLVLTGPEDADVTAALAQLKELSRADPLGTPRGLRALADAGGRRVSDGETLTFAELGIPDTHVAARTHRIAFDLALPHDFMPADYDKLILDLDAGYPAGLAPGAQIVVEINGANAASAPLGRPGGEAMNRRAVFLPLRLLRPGFNRIAIRAELPRTDDQACADETGVPTERLFLAGSSRLTIPPLARVGRQPEIAETVAEAFPYAGSARRPTLVVPAPDRDTMAAAATLVARLGLAAGRVLPFAFAAGRAAITGPTVFVSTARTLDGTVLTAAGLDPQALLDAWADHEAAPSRESGPALRRRVLRTDGIAACSALAPPLPEAVAEAAAKPDGKRGVRTGGPVLAEAAALIAQGITGPAEDDLLTLVTAPTAASLREAVACLVHPRVWKRPEGRLTALSSIDGSVIIEAAAEPRYVATLPPAPANLRRVAAGWLSLHAGLYGLFGLLLAGGLAGSTQLLVRNLGRRSE
ncbi:cellulose biosynthesis cyclic di-GMP-binding regulatory protein BcsB [Methylobacterium sp. GC_Met_2]|uniref:cellulose biosynthesis cyclic di-GMP-binding regulatory protein BcsB n=1 Tax=Methylobacterium sp. GC_Met_2 TaxID=2937376 RepID=UPI00226B6204|nr:cellulose biosynthesis cyclic di-GMP-binding regulatory protein BcsB [Methylobacterium sp. GC_Met_2]